MAKESAQQRAPEPAVQISCLVCRNDQLRVICDVAEIAAQHRYLLRFHQRRLRRVAASAAQDRIDFTQDYSTNIVACLACGLIFRNPRPTKEAVTRAYAQDDYDPEHLRTAFETHLELARTKAGALAYWLPQRPGLKIVEVGSFVGSFLAAGRERAWDMLGVDPGEQAVAFCRGKGLPVVRGTLPEIALPPRSVDCVAIWNTFDQLPDPRPTLKAARDALRPGGVLAIRIPNGACFDASMRRMEVLPAWASAWLRRALVWNNLLMFPYLVGYSVPNADRLLRRFDFRRLAVQPDTLVTLADRNLRWWAALEERLVKAGCRAAAAVESLLFKDSHAAAPWLDLYYRKAEADDTPVNDR